MEPLIVSAASAAAYMGLDPSDTALINLLTPLIVETEALLATDCNRSDRPFAAAMAGRNETQDGTGSRSIYVDYPIAALTSIVLGHDVNDPVETLDVADPAIVQWRVGSRRIRRLDAAFGKLRQPGYVHIVYDSLSDVPADAPLAIKRRVAAIWQDRGSEGASSERFGPVTLQSTLAASDEIWRTVCDANREVII